MTYYMTGQKCKVCKGTGYSLKMDDHRKECTLCEGSGIKLQTKIEEDYKDGAELSGDILFEDQNNFVDLE